jgi:hypothetical protein
VSDDWFALIPAAVFLDPDLNAHEKLTVSVLILHRNAETGCSFPSISRMSRLAGLSEKTVKRAVATLEKKGKVLVKRRLSPSGDWDTNLYSLRGWGLTVPTWGHTDPTSGQADPRVGSHSPQGWGLTDPLTYPYRQTQKQEKSSPKKGGSKTLNHRGKIEEAFSMFWQVYPKKQGKRAALEEFSRLFPLDLPGETLNARLQNICGQALLYSESVEGTEPRYIKAPKNWLKECDPDEAATVEVETWVRETEEPQ